MPIRGMNAEMEDPNKVREIDSSSLPKDYLSFSQIDLYRRCGMAYYFRYIMDEKSPPVANMVQGRAVHAALELNFDQKIQTKKDLPEQQVLDKFSEEFDEGIKDAADVNSTEKGKIKDDSVEFLGKYHERYAPTIQPYAVEEEFKIQLDNIEIKGYIDLVQELPGPLAIAEHFDEKKAKEVKKSKHRSKVIVDHKVTSRKKAQNDTDNSLQLSIYSMALGIPNVRYDALIVNPTSKSTMDQRIVQTLSHRTKADLEFDKSVILSIAEAITKGVFPKTGQGTWMCSEKFCPHFKICREKK